MLGFFSKKTDDAEKDEEGFVNTSLKASEIEDKKGQKFKGKIGEVTVFKCNGQLFALSSACSHQGYDLTVGDIEDIDGKPCVVCPKHKMKFFLESGASVSGNKTYKQKCFLVKTKDDLVWIKKAD